MTPQLPTWSELRLVMPEVWLVLAMCAVILVPFIKRTSAALITGTAVVGLVLALVAALQTLADSAAVFSGMLTVDPFSQFMKLLIVLFTLLVIVQWLLTDRRETHIYDTPDFLCLLLGAATGMCLMASASNLLMIFVATEAASLPSFALAGFRKRHRTGSEGSLKYVVFGSAASAVAVYGMSLVYGSTGTLDLASLAAVAAQGVSPLLAVGLLAMFAGFAFKLSAVPLHFWCPDVFQGAPIEVTTFLSVASKGAAIALVLRVLAAFGAAAPVGSDVFFGLGVGVAILGGVTATWGNLVAIHQDNVKRLLAYSSIAHAGYMIMAASVIVVAGRNPGSDLSSSTVAGAVLFYLLVYLFMNLGAFTVASLIVQRTGTEDIRNYAGLIKRSPVLAVLMTVFLLSLFGMPGLGGFMGKVYLMAAMAKVGPTGLALVAVLLLNTLVSLYYYMRPVYHMILVPDTQGRPSWLPRGAALGVLGVCAAVLLYTGILPGTLGDVTRDYATIRLEAPKVAQASPPPTADTAATQAIVPPAAATASTP